ncbi:hypothetical protein [Streptomyces chattanoogensis]|uniref:hypothetical protein n=1 Tax=Streptomyces chattanoogensis TaxID=66876 RepID=UPI000B091E64|nr:hypothetical protein [Streptomyces chattanoogensis]
MKRLAALATAVAASLLIILGAGTAHADNHKPGSGSASIGTAPITEGLQKILTGSFAMD